MRKEKCKECGKYVPRKKFVWTADSEGLCLDCCGIKHITPTFSPDDGLLYAVHEENETGLSEENIQH